ncbi:MerR family transcriptional regulator [Agromyces sp. MMS24-JH15]|uniref:transcriptional regulator FtsR n=1 Tax=Agromyces sp. MMS24-JH15 TaxID=3243765 RepID=UPI003749D98E
MAGSAAHEASAAPGLSGIGQVLAALQPEFPELTPSKLRFLEEQGLVAPARTPAGYRKFSGADIDRIRFILAAQRDHYLPLKVIRTHLAAIDAGETPALPSATAPREVRPPVRLRRDDLLRSTGASAALLDEAISAGLIPAAELHGEDAVAVLRSLTALREAGIEPRHLRSIRVAAEREAALVAQAIAPSRRHDAADRARAAERTLELARHLETVRREALRQALSQIAR